jgi:hypothetical protein
MSFEMISTDVTERQRARIAAVSTPGVLLPRLIPASFVHGFFFLPVLVLGGALLTKTHKDDEDEEDTSGRKGTLTAGRISPLDTHNFSQSICISFGPTDKTVVCRNSDPPPVSPSARRCRSLLLSNLRSAISLLCPRSWQHGFEGEDVRCCDFID